MGYFVRYFIILLHEEQKKRRPKRIILIRHGNSIANNNYDILQHTPDNKIVLSEKGVQQALEAGKKLKQLVGDESVQFYVSPYKRTRQTYEYILQSFKNNHSDCIISSSLREQEYGNLQSEMDKQFEEQKHVGAFIIDLKTEKVVLMFMQECLFFYNIFLEEYFQLIIMLGIISLLFLMP